MIRIIEPDMTTVIAGVNFISQVDEDMIENMDVHKTLRHN